WVAGTDGSAPVRWTSPGTESSNPRWTPDGKYLLFTSQRAGGKGNTWAIRLDQPGGEALQLDRYPTQGTFNRTGTLAAWSEAVPEDSSTRTIDAYQRMGAMSRPPFDAITRPTDPARYDGRHVVDMRYKSNETGFVPGRRTMRTWRPAQLWVQATDGSAKRQLTDTKYSHQGAELSPDGQWIAFIADAKLRPDSVVELERDSLAKLPYDKARDEADRNDTDLYVVPVTGGTPRKVVEAMGAESQIEWSADSKRLAYVAAPRRTDSRRVYVVPVTGGTPVNVLGDWQFEPSQVRWHENGTLYMLADVGGRSALFRIDQGARRPVELIGGRRRLNGFSIDATGRQVAFVGTSMTRPTEVFLADATGGNERKLTAFNDALNAEVAWADAERFTYRSVGDLEIEGWLMKPHGYEPGKKYPLVLYIHGGPHSAYGEGWFDEFQNLAAQGMWVLFTNPRGSSGYGGAFTYSTRGRWGLEDYEDLMKAVDIVHRLHASGRRRHAPRCERWLVRRLHDDVDGHPHAGVPRHPDGSHHHRLDLLVRRERCAGAHGVRVLRQAVGQPGALRHALAHPLRAAREDADAHRAERGGPPHADGERRAVVHGAQEAGRARGAGALSAQQSRPLAQWRAVAARRSPRAAAPVVRLLAAGPQAHRPPRARRGGSEPLTPSAGAAW
nr:prolyl oligopeptidase family serine peptidase [Gemmatimonadaceae bacterium]